MQGEVLMMLQAAIKALSQLAHTIIAMVDAPPHKARQTVIHQLVSLSL